MILRLKEITFEKVHYRTDIGKQALAFEREYWHGLSLFM